MGVAIRASLSIRMENLYVGDRGGTIFKISRTRQIYVFATLEASIAAYHLAFGTDNHLYVTGPTTSSFDSVYRISPAGEVETYYRAWAVRKASRLTRTGRVVCGPDRSEAAAAWFVSINNGIRSCFFPGPGSWAWPSLPRARSG